MSGRSKVHGHGWLAVGIAVGLVVAPVSVGAATATAVKIVNSSGRVAAVTKTNQLRTVEAAPDNYVRNGAGGFISADGCQKIIEPPAGKAMVLKQVNIDVFSNSTPGSSHSAALYVGTGCVSQFARVTPAGIGLEHFPFDPGVAVPSGHAVWVRAFGSVAVATHSFGYSIPAAAAPSG